MSNDKQTNVGQELVERLQNLNKMLEAIGSTKNDELNLQAIKKQNKPVVEPKNLPKRKK